MARLHQKARPAIGRRRPFRPRGQRPDGAAGSAASDGHENALRHKKTAPRILISFVQDSGCGSDFGPPQGVLNCRTRLQRPLQRRRLPSAGRPREASMSFTMRSAAPHFEHEPDPQWSLQSHRPRFAIRRTAHTIAATTSSAATTVDGVSSMGTSMASFFLLRVHGARPSGTERRGVQVRGVFLAASIRAAACARLDSARSSRENHRPWEAPSCGALPRRAAFARLSP